MIGTYVTKALRRALHLSVFLISLEYNLGEPLGDSAPLTHYAKSEKMGLVNPQKLPQVNRPASCSASCSYNLKNLTKCNLGKKGFTSPSRVESITKGSQSSNLERKSRRTTASWFVVRSMCSYFLYTCLGMVLPIVGWDFLHDLLNKKSPRPI